MSEKHSHSPASELEREFELERMIFFSDAIFAIAITLMVIDVKWPEIPESVKGVDILRMLNPTIVQFVVLIISFFVVGRAWKLHLRLFRQLKNYNQVLINLNLFFLFFIVIFPFTASGIVGHIRNGFAYPYLFYVFNMTGVGFTDFLITRYIFKVKPDLSIRGQEEEKKFIYTRAKYNAGANVLVFFILLLVAILFPGNSKYLAFGFCVYPLAIRISNNKLKKFKPKTTAL
jgi:uncharacterized membrane protein